MDDLWDMSPIEQELEALTAIYLDELEVHRSENSQQVEEVELLLHPATASDTTKQFVRMNLVFLIGHNYPDEVPAIVVRNPRGLGEEEIAGLLEDMRMKATESVGEVMLYTLIESGLLGEEEIAGLVEDMRTKAVESVEEVILYTLIEMAKESLTEGNIPHCPCVVCLEHFQEHDVFHRTACYHYFHTRCLHKYLEHSRDQLEQDRIEAEEHRHLNPEDEKEKPVIVCPVCRTAMDGDSLAVFCSDDEEEAIDDIVIPHNIQEQQKKMAELYEKQKSKGGIIDVEWNRNKFLLNLDERAPVVSETTRVEGKPSAENSCQDNSNDVPERSSRNEPTHTSHISDKHQRGGGAARKWGYGSSSDHERAPRHHQYQRSHDDRRMRGGHRQHDRYSDERRDNDTDRGGTYGSGRGRSPKHREDSHRHTDTTDRIVKQTGNDCDNSRDWRSSDDNRFGHSRASEDDDSSSVTFVNSGSKHRGDNYDGGMRSRDGGFDGYRGRGGGRSERGRGESHGRGGRGRRGGFGGRDDISYGSKSGDESRWGRGGHNRNETSSSSQERRDLHDKGSSRVSSRASNMDEEEEEGRNDRFDRYGPSQRGRGRGGGGNEQRRGRGARGAGGRRGDERGFDDEENQGDRGTANRASYSNSDRSNYSGYRNDSRMDSRSYKKSYDDDDEQQQNRQGYDGQYRNPRRGGGGERRSEFTRGDCDERRGQGYGDGSRGRDSRGRGVNRSDQRGGGRKAGGFRRRDGEEDEEECRGKENDLKNIEINQRWRDLNFQRRQDDDRALDDGRKKRPGFGVVDDDEEDKKDAFYKGLNNDDDDGDEYVRDNANYNNGNNAYTVASSDSEEDWGKESDPFTFERRNIRHAQFEEYTKYKASHLNYLADKTEKRAEKQNSTRDEQRRIQREQLLKNQRAQRAQVEEREQQATTAATSESLSVLDRFKQDQEKKQMKEKGTDSSQRSGNSNRNNAIVQRGNDGAETANSKYGGRGSNHNLSGGKDAEHARKKAGALPNRNKVEGIKWVGVRNQDDVRDSDDASAAGGRSLGGNAFDDSWRRREEKERQRRKQPGFKAKKKEESAENRESGNNSNNKRDKLSNDTDDPPVDETKVRSRRRRDRERESQGLHRRDFDTRLPEDNSTGYAPGDNVNKQLSTTTTVSSNNGITQVSSIGGVNASSSNKDDHNRHHDNLQRKSRNKKPLDLRKKTNYTNATNDNNENGKPTSHPQTPQFNNDFEQLVEKFPSLLQDNNNESLKKEKSPSETNGILMMVSKSDPLQDGKGDVADSACVVVNDLPTDKDKDSNVSQPKLKSKRKPLDFRKGVKKDI